MSNDSQILTGGSSDGPIDHEALALTITRLYDRKADQIYVIMDAKQTTVVKDPGLGRPWSSTNLKHAENTARLIAKQNPQMGARVTTLSDAIKLLIREQVRRN